MEGLELERTYKECPNCGKFKLALFIELYPEFEDVEVDGWRRILPWNWKDKEYIGTREFKTRKCKNCHYTAPPTSSKFVAKDDF